VSTTFLGNTNLIGVADVGNVTMGGTGNLTGTQAAPLDAKLGPLANNGGPTQTHALTSGSPAINAGSNPAALPNDQRGVARNVGGNVDIGAVELQNFVVLNDNDSGTGSFRQAILDANTYGGFDSISFDPTFFSTPRTIKLTGGELAISDTVLIVGPGAAQATINGNNLSRVFNTKTAAAGALINISGLTITGGMADISGGGGLYVSDEAVTLTNCVITANTGHPGGVFVGSGSLTATDCTFSNNSSGTSSTAGGIDAFGSSAKVSLFRCTVSGNSGASGGGGIHARNYLLLDGCTISSNVATSGGGLYLSNESVTNSLIIRNTTFSGNTAAAHGGGIALYDFSGTLLIQNSTFTLNKADVGGAIGEYSETPPAGITIESSILFGDSANTSGPELFGGDYTVNTSLLASKSGSTSFTGDAFTNGHIGVNPLLGPLANNGGPTQTHAIMAGSPAIDNGSNPGSLTTDQRGTGYPRVLNTVPDIGAVEAADLVVRNTNDSGKDSLRQRVLDANAIIGTRAITFDTTVFASAKTITVKSEIAIFEAMTITGPSVQVTINGTDTFTMTASRIFNTSVAPAGAMILLQNLALTNGKVTGNGGAILVQDEFLRLVNCSVTNSTASSSGGAIHVTTGGSLLIEDSTLNGNKSSGGGGAINIGGAANLVIRESSITANNATNGGGAISAVFNGTILLENSTLAGNTAAFGGAIEHIMGKSTDSLTIRNCTISGNTASQSGGGVTFGSLQGGLFLIQNSTITANKSTSGSGGGLSQISGGQPVTIVVASSIISGNTSSQPNPDISVIDPVTANFSAIGNPNGFVLSGSSGNNLPFGTDLKLGPLANNGGPTQTHALLSGSPAIDAGSNPAMLTNDQRGAGFPRVVGSAADIGAFEAQTLASPPTVTSIVINDGTPQRSLVTSLKVSFSEAVDFPSGVTAAFTVERTSGGPLGQVGLSFNPSSGPASDVTITFNNTGAVGVDPGNSLSDGRYLLTIVADKITGSGGSLDGDNDGVAEGYPTDNKTMLFHRLFGDADGNATVNSSDFGVFRTFFGLGASIFDFTADGSTNSNDFAEFRKRFGLSI
jgi:hypothetical protein